MWFFDDFVPTARKHLRIKRLKEKGLLLVDNCQAHPNADELYTDNGQKIMVVYLCWPEYCNSTSNS